MNKQQKMLLTLDLQFFAEVNYAEAYQQALSQVYTSGLRFAALYNTPNNALVRWTSAKTIQVPTITTGGFVDVDRDVVGNFTRRVDNQWTPYTLEHDREFRTLVDPMDIDETNMALSIMNITRVFNTEHKIPEMDKYMASKLFAEYTTRGGEVNEEALTTANVLSLFDTMMEEMDDAEVPQDGRILYVTPKVATILKNAENISRSISITGGNGANINRNVRSLDEVEIVTVPTSRMKTAYNFTDGAVPASSARQINMILISPNTIYAPQKYEFVSVDEPTAATGGKYLYYERKYWDVFVIQQRVPGIKMNVEAAAGVGA